MKKHGKTYVEASNVIEDKLYTPKEAIKVLKSMKTRKFDETVEVAIKTNIDAKKSDSTIRNSVVLPKGIGKTKKVLVITKNSIDEAKKAKADYVGSEEIIEKIEKENWFDYDVIVATPDIMSSLSKLGKILGPKGLMPNPKLGTVTTNIEQTITNIKKGMIEYKNDTFGNIHAPIGKLSFKESDLEENLIAFINEIIKNKPSGIKGTFIKSITISSTMSPGIKIDKNFFDNK